MSYLRLNPLDELKEGRARLRILLVGVNYYRDEESFSPLNFAVKDCEELAKAFQQVTERFKDSHQNFTTQIIPLFGLEASPLTADSITTELGHLLQGVTAKDTVIVYFSGHGKIDEETQKFYLCLTDTSEADLAGTGLDVQRLLNQLKQSGVKKQIILLDACHSAAGNLAARGKGATIAAPRSNRATPDPEPAGPEPADTDLSSRLQGIVQEFAVPDRDFYALLSCGANQQSWECPELKHGVFTYYLIQGLLQEATVESQGQLFIRSLHEYVEHRTEHYCRYVLKLKPNQIQTPVFVGSGKGHALIVGLRSQTPANNLGNRRERQQQYRDQVWQTLEQQYPRYPNDPDKRNQLQRAWQTQFPTLSPNELTRIAAETIAEFEEYLSHYKSRAIATLLTAYPPAADPFQKLRQAFGLRPEVVEEQEQQAHSLFNRQKDRYLAAAFEQLHPWEAAGLTPERRKTVATHLNDLQLAIEAELQEFEIEVGFAAIADALIAEASNHLATQAQLYRECCSRCLRQPAPEREQERAQLEQTLQERYKFPAEQLLKIYREIAVTVKQDEECYEAEFLRLLQQDTDA